MSARDFLDERYSKWPLNYYEIIDSMEAYARESVKLSLQKASENIKMVDLNKYSKIPNSDYCWVVDKESITYGKNIILA